MYVILFIVLQSLNAYSPIEVTFDGIVILSKSKQFSNELFLIVINSFGSLIESTILTSINADVPITVSSFIAIFVKLLGI